jgi:integrase
MKAYLEPEEVAQIEKVASNLRDKLLIRTLFHLGCRVTEALGLTVEDIVKNTYVVAPRLRWQGLLQNPLPKCWSIDLSKGWAGTEIGDNRVEKQTELFHEHRLVATDGKTIITGEMRARRVKLEDIHTSNQNYSVWLDPFTNTQWLE